MGKSMSMLDKGKDKIIFEFYTKTRLADLTIDRVLDDVDNTVSTYIGDKYQGQQVRLGTIKNALQIRLNKLTKLFKRYKIEYRPFFDFKGANQDPSKFNEGNNDQIFYIPPQIERKSGQGLPYNLKNYVLRYSLRMLHSMNYKTQIVLNEADDTIISLVELWRDQGFTSIVFSHDLDFPLDGVGAMKYLCFDEKDETRKEGFNVGDFEECDFSKWTIDSVQSQLKQLIIAIQQDSTKRTLFKALLKTRAPLDIAIPFDETVEILFNNTPLYSKIALYQKLLKKPNLDEFKVRIYLKSVMDQFYRIKHYTFHHPNRGISIRNIGDCHEDLKKWKNMTLDQYLQYERQRLGYKKTMSFYKQREEKLIQLNRPSPFLPTGRSNRISRQLQTSFLTMPTSQQSVSAPNQRMK